MEEQESTILNSWYPNGEVFDQQDDAEDRRMAFLPPVRAFVSARSSATLRFTEAKRILRPFFLAMTMRVTDCLTAYL
jgi:hypothetical protein